jgi:hypothetical protein
MNNPIQTEQLLQFLQECKGMSSKTETLNNNSLHDAENVKTINYENSPQSITLTFSNFKIDVKFLGTK